MEKEILDLIKEYVNDNVVRKIQFINLLVDMPLQQLEKVLQYFKEDELMEEILNGRK